MKFLRWIVSLFSWRGKGYSFKFPIGFQKKKKRTALFGGSHRSMKGR